MHSQVYTDIQFSSPKRHQLSVQPRVFVSLSLSLSPFLLHPLSIRSHTHGHTPHRLFHIGLFVLLIKLFIAT